MRVKRPNDLATALQEVSGRIKSKAQQPFLPSSKRVGVSEGPSPSLTVSLPTHRAAWDRCLGF